MLHTNPRSLFDLSELYQMAHGQRGFVCSIVDSFLEHTPHVATQLTAATAAAEWGQVGALVHKIKPSLKVLHAHELVEVVRVLEDKATQPAERAAAVRQLTQLLSRLLSELKHWRQTQYY
jgi:HPt (histidine-containing phosphotransfer) domain-containing protein